MIRLLIILCLITPTIFAGDKIIDSVGYRLYHNMDNEHDGSKYRAYVTKNINNNKFKFAYERTRNGQGFETGTWFIDHEIKF